MSDLPSRDGSFFAAEEGPERSPRARWTALAVAVCTFGAISGLRAWSASAGGDGVPVPQTGAYLGAWVKPPGWSQSEEKQAVTDFESEIGRPLGIDQIYPAWGESAGSSVTWHSAWDVSAGRIPLLTWGGGNSNEITAGTWDDYINGFAQAVKAIGAPVFIRYGAEMELSQNQSWVVSPSAYVAAWRHIHDLFAAQGANNVSWVWAPDAGAFPDVAPQYYPGDAYVDWIAADGYEWYPGKQPSTWKSFSTIFSAFYAWGAATGKPLMVSETGVQEDPDDPSAKQTWFTDSLAAMKGWPDLKAFVYFNSDKAYPWWIDSSTASLQGFGTLAGDPYMSPDSPSPSPSSPSPSPTASPSPSPSTSPSPSPSPSPPPEDPSRPIVFDSDRTENRQIFLISADGTTVTQLTDSRDNFAPALSPDGTQIAFTRTVKGNADVWVKNVDGTHLRRLTHPKAFDGYPAWSADGAEIAFQSRRSGDEDVYTIGADGLNVLPLTNKRSNDQRPAWSPDGSHIAFASNREGTFDIFTVTTDGTVITQLTATEARDRAPNWSPDGSRIAFQSDRSGNLEVYTMGPLGANVSQITDCPDGDFAPAWSPDGSQIVFGSSRSGGDQLFVADASGANVAQYTHAGDVNQLASWAD